MRLLAASMVIFSHSFFLSGIPLPHNHKWLSLAFKSGGVGVSIFFVMSGFLITQSFQNSDNIFSFLWKRILRIYPALLVALSLTVLLGIFVTKLSFSAYILHPDTRAYLLNFFIPQDRLNHLPGVFEGNPYTSDVNGSLWTIRIELLLYLLTAFIGITGRLKEKTMIWLTFLAFAAYMLAQDEYKLIPGAKAPEVESIYALRNILFFSIGSLFYCCGIKKNNGNLLLALIAALLLSQFSHDKAFEFFLIPLLPFIVIQLAFIRPGNILNHLGKYGDYSYGMYIYAYPVQQTLIHFLQGKIHLWQYIILSFAVTFIFAFLSWHLIEKHAIKLKRIKKNPIQDSFGQQQLTLWPEQYSAS